MPEANNDYYESGPQQETHLWDHLHALLGRRRVVLTVFSAVVALATLRTHLKESVYEGTAPPDLKPDGDSQRRGD
jgi:hypothetical protein